MKTVTCKIMDAVNAYGAELTQGKGTYLHLNSVEDRYLFSVERYLRAFNGPFTPVSKSEFNDLVSQLETNFGECLNYSTYKKAYKSICFKKSQPVFTQAMADNGELPKVGSKCHINYPGGNHDCEVLGYNSDYVWFSGMHMCRTLRVDKCHFKPIDTRTDKEKAADDLDKLDYFHKLEGEEFINDVVNGKIHGVKWVGE